MLEILNWVLSFASAVIGVSMIRQAYLDFGDEDMVYHPLTYLGIGACAIAIALPVSYYAF